MTLARREQGHALIIYAIAVPAMLLAVGMAVDVGMAYIEKAKLTKAVDAACLAGMKNLSLGNSTATTIATHMFNANYGNNPPTPTISFPTDGNGGQQVSVTATTSPRTYFAQLAFRNWTIADTAVATRGQLVMALVLDRSGSMTTNGGQSALQSAVPTFVNYFDDTYDHVALVSFASNASVDFAMGVPFKTPITNAVKNMSFGGGTFGSGGTYVAGDGPPLTLADHQIAGMPVRAGQNVVRVVVYFTDGLMNAVQDTFNCPNPVLLNYGGYDSGNYVGVFDPPTGTQFGTVPSSGPNQGDLPYDAVPHYCQSGGTYVTTFYSQQYKAQQSLTRDNITAEAQYRALQTAAAMRAENPATFIFTIGLGSGVSSTTQTFLKQLANDPGSPTYNANLPQGMFLYVPDCPSTNCTNELQTAFQAIASKILLRLTQ
jgi:Flp pilus assembly protein TadG